MTSCKATLYEHGSFDGWRAELIEGEYRRPQLEAAGVRNDHVSSLKVEGGENCCLVVYEHSNFDGWNAKFTQGEYKYEQMRDRGAEQDRISSA